MHSRARISFSVLGAENHFGWCRESLWMFSFQIPCHRLLQDLTRVKQGSSILEYIEYIAYPTCQLLFAIDHAKG